MELVTGGTGYVGGRLIDRLLGEDRQVRALVRDPSRLRPRPGVEVVRGDVLTSDELERLLEGCTTAYYLVHSMEPDVGEDFASQERRGAERFARAAQAAGIERIVYLGGLAPAEGAPSRHIASRLEVERVLLEAVPGSTALRASILIGAGSVSFRILVRLLERMPALLLPAWRDRRTRPIAERDAIEFLARTPATVEAAGRSLDIAGPDELSYGQMLGRIASQMNLIRPPIGLAATQTPMASAIVASITEEPLEIVRPLMESLQHDLLPRDDEAARIYDLAPRPFEDAVERALWEWDEAEAESASAPPEPLKG